METPTCSVVIPVYKGQDTIVDLVERLGKVLPNISKQFEVILVNDGSPDNSWSVVEHLARQYPWVVGICLMRNFGQHNALLCGIRQARYDIVVTMDDDLQHPPESIQDLIKELDNGFDVVYGIPQKMPHSFWRNVTSRFSKWILALVMGIKNIRDINAFRVFRTDLRMAFEYYNGYQVSLDVLLSWGTSKFGTVVVNQMPRQFGKSNYTFVKLVKRVLALVTGYSTLPLRIASLWGFSFMFFGMGVLVYVVGRYLIAGYSVPGFPFLASIISIFSGVQLFTLGIIGEYLALMYARSMEHPAYVVRKVIRSDESV